MHHNVLHHTLKVFELGSASIFMEFIIKFLVILVWVLLCLCYECVLMNRVAQSVY